MGVPFINLRVFGDENDEGRIDYSLVDNELISVSELIMVPEKNGYTGAMVYPVFDETCVMMLFPDYKNSAKLELYARKDLSYK